MLGDITIYKAATSGGGHGSWIMNVAASAGAGTTVTATGGTILAGQPVTLVAGASAVALGGNNLITLPSPFVPYSVTGTGLVGISESNSTETTTTAGTVEIRPVNPQDIWLINVKVSADVSTQAKYDALVGHRVLIDLTSGSYTMLSSDSALNGCIIQPLTIAKYPNKIAFSFLPGISAL